MDLRKKSKAEITSYIAAKKRERNDIQKEIQDLNHKREAYIASKKKDNDKGELENAMITAIQKQAAKKNYRWE